VFGRRTLLTRGARLGLGLSLRPSLLFGQDDQTSARPKENDLLVQADNIRTEPLTPDDVGVGAPTMAWAMDPHDLIVRSGSRLNRVLLVRLDPTTLVGETQSRAANGVVAYTAICTHSGCDVADWIADQQLLACPCHDSRFDPRDGAKVVDGPAPRPLPALPLKIVDGKLVVANPFTARVGFEPA
jgi:rieske iron-sulfur protein